MRKVNVLYFAQLAENLGVTTETLELPAAIATIAQLQHHLATRGNNWETVAEVQIKAAVNHTLCKSDHPIDDGDEIAFFPPVTGG